METSLHPLLPVLSDVLAQRMGLHYPRERWPDLMRGIEAASRELRMPDTTRCIHALMGGPLGRNQIEVLARHLTIGETYLFREPQVFEALQNHALPQLIQARRESGRRLRIWSAGCSTGEEAYSLAIMLQRMIPDFAQWDITILGTDINPQALEKAAAGVYGAWSFRNAPPWLRERYFHEVQGRYHIVPEVREMVSFAYLNLAEDSYPSPTSNTHAMDLVFCRNVLMYFEPMLAAQVVRKIHLALVEGGWLVVSPSEISQTSFARFNPVYLEGAILHQKASARAAMPDSPVVPAPIPTPPPIIAQPQPAPAPPSKAKRQRLAATQPKVVVAPDYEHAHALYQKGRYAEAVAEATRLLELNQDALLPMLLLARIHANRGALAEALHWCRRSIAVERLNPTAHYLSATILQEQDRTDEAAQAYKRALYLDQDFVLAHFALGNLLRYQDKFEEAGKHFDIALRLLERYPPDEVLPESEDLSAARLQVIIRNGAARKEHAA